MSSESVFSIHQDEDTEIQKKTLIGFLFIVVFGVVIFLLYKEKILPENDSSPDLVPVGSSSVQNENQKSEEIVWKTYTRDPAFRIKYPSNFNIQEEDNIAVFYLDTHSRTLPQFILVMSFENPDNLVLSDWLVSTLAEQSHVVVEGDMVFDEESFADVSWAFITNDVSLEYISDGRAYWGTSLDGRVYLVILTNLDYGEYESVIRDMLHTFEIVKAES